MSSSLNRSLEVGGQISSFVRPLAPKRQNKLFEFSSTEEALGCAKRLALAEVYIYVCVCMKLEFLAGDSNNTKKEKKKKKKNIYLAATCC